MSTSTSTSTSSTSKTRTSTTTDSTVRPGLRTGEQVVAVQFGAWGPQEVTVRAYSDGGRGGAPLRRRRGGDLPDLRLRPGRRRLT